MELGSSYFKKVYRYTPSEQAKKLPFYMRLAGWRAYEPGITNKREEGEFSGFQIQYVIRGKGHIWLDNRKYTVESNELFFLDMSRAHTYYADYDDPWEAIWILFDGEQTQTYYHLAAPDNPIYAIESRADIEQRLHAILALFVERPIGVDVLFSAYVTAILSELIVQRLNQALPRRNHFEYRQEVGEAIRYIEQYYERPIVLKEIAEHVKFSPYHFSRLFKRVTGYTVGEFIMKYRMTQAKLMLADTDRSLADVAERNGFSDHSHMGRVFRKYERLTPRQYRLKAKEQGE